MEIKNACTVHRIWIGDASSRPLSTADLLAAFQYDSDAKAFAELAVASDRHPKNTYLTVVSHYSGEMWVFAPPAGAGQKDSQS